MNDPERINVSLRQDTLKKADVLKRLRSTTRSGLLTQLINEEFDRRHNAEPVDKSHIPTPTRTKRTSGGRFGTG